VYRHVDTFQKTEDQAGIINSNGDWHIRLTNDPTLVSATKIVRLQEFGFKEIIQAKYGISRQTSSITQVVHNLNYCGEGVFTLLPEKPAGLKYPDTRFYNILTGSDRTLPISDDEKYDGNGTGPKRFENGQGVFKSSGIVYGINKSGIISEIINYSSNIRNAGLGNYVDGLFYFSATVNYRDVSSLDYQDTSIPGESSGFHDISGKRVIDLSEYNLRTMPVFMDGYCVLNLRNPQKVGYYTVIDKSGKEMFEPRQSPSEQRKGPFQSGTDYFDLSTKCGMIVIAEGRSFGAYSVNYRSWTIINAMGDKVAEFGEGYAISDYCEDVALVNEIKGEVYYIDKTGKRLF
jgi:hypothetical protein